MDSTILSVLSLALGLGLLIGLQRQRASSRLGGIRTFPLIALLGAVCGLLAAQFGALIVLGGFIGVTAMTVLANLGPPDDSPDVRGQTSEAAALLTYALGVFLATGNYAAAMVVGGITAVLLHAKQSLHGFAGSISERDVQAVMRFVIISLIILPVLPDRTFGPYDVLNPRQIWWMVVLIVGIGLCGYVTFKFVRGRTGAVLAGILGGLVSSTATTVAYARRVRDHADAAALGALVLSIAWTITIVRVIVEVAVVAPNALAQIAPPLVVLLVLMAAVTALTRLLRRTDGAQMPEPGNPAELKSALVFAVLYAIVTFAIAIAKDHFGDQALYVVAVVSGFLDVDAITLSTAQLASDGSVDGATAVRAIMLAVLANTFFKLAVAGWLGGGALLMRMLPLFASLLAGSAALLIWPELLPAF